MHIKVTHIPKCPLNLILTSIRFFKLTMKVHKILGINLGLSKINLEGNQIKYVGIFSHIFLCWRHIILHCPGYHVKSKHYMISQ